mmetsp:Transcript_25360/g.64483  ORF Transcript_25360/g.64483 Transcript_25360/m.64483 type:complete len:206 (+) Transcript_25360:145-762(+)
MQPPTNAWYWDTKPSFDCGQSLHVSMSILIMSQRLCVSSGTTCDLSSTFLVLCAMHFWCSMGRSGRHGELFSRQCAGAAGSSLGRPMLATLPGSNRMVATQVERLSWNLPHDARQSRPAPRPRAAESRRAFEISEAPWPSGADSVGHWPQTSRQSAGAQAPMTAAASPAGEAFAFTQPSQSWHQPWTFGLPSAVLPRLQRTSAGS